MRHAFASRGIVGCSLMLSMALGALALQARAQDTTLEARQVGPHSWVLLGETGVATVQNQGFTSNAGFVVTGDGVVAFDTLGTPALGRAMLDAIRRVTPLPVRVVVLSHYHADHYYGAQAFKAAGAQVWAHEAGRGVTASDAAQQRLAQRRADLFPWIDDNTRLTDADRWLHFDGGGEITWVAGGLRLRLIDVSGAHSPEDIMLSVDDDGVLFAGDLYFSGRLPLAVGADTARWLQALERIRLVDPKVAVPGHGAPSQQLAQDLALTRDYLRHLRDTMGRAVHDMIDFEQAYDAADWSAWLHLPTFAQANRLNARSVYLEMEAESLRPR